MAEEKQQSGESSAIPPPRVDLGMLGRANTPLKRTWPEVVGLTAEGAEKKIKEEMPRVQIQVVPAGSFVTMDYNQGRVRLYVDSSGKVANPPKIG